MNEWERGRFESGDNTLQGVSFIEAGLVNLTDEGLQLELSVSFVGDMPKGRELVRIKLWCDWRNLNLANYYKCSCNRTELLFNVQCVRTYAHSG